MKLNFDEIKNKLDAVGEIRDGLFAFAQQAQFAIDASLYVVGDDEQYFVVDEYEFGVGNERADIFNLSAMGDFDVSLYNKTSTVVYTTREEMMEHFAQFMRERNHF